MASAFVYGGQGRPVRTQFQMQPQQGGIGSLMGGQPSGMLARPPQMGGMGQQRFGAFGGLAQGAMGAGGAAPAAASNWDPNNPFANVPDLQSGIRAMLAHGGAAFGPNYLRDILRKSAFLRQKNQLHRGDVLSRLAGLDRMQQRQAMVDTERQSGSDLTDALNNADIQGAQGWQQFLQSLLGSERGGESSGFQQRDQFNREQAARGGGLGDFLGGAIGTGVGAYTGGLGTRLSGSKR